MYMTTEIIQAHLNLLYPGLSLMTEAQMQQLSWNQNSTTTTSEKDTATRVPPTVEVLRCTSRLYNLDLFYKGKSEHAAFTLPQEKNNQYSPVLSAADFEVLCQRFQDHDALKKETLKVATVISSVFSPKAKAEADRVLGKGKWSPDSVEFFADAFDDIEKAKAIFPLVDDLFKNHPNPEDQKRITRYLQTAFAHFTHYRHMLYTEGSSKMFRQLLADYKAGKINEDTLNFLICYWTVNIAGFRAQTDKNVTGSNYLTENTFKGMQALEKQLYRVLKEPDVTEQDLLNGYLDERAAFLQLDTLSDKNPLFKDLKLTVDEKRFIAHVGALMRLYHPDEGAVLVLGYTRITNEQKNDYAQLYFNYELPTPTYGPSVFQNAIDYRVQVYGDQFFKGLNKDNFTQEGLGNLHRTRRLVAIADVTIGIVPAYFDVIARHQMEVEAELKSSTIPLNFNAVAFNKEISKFCACSPILEPYNILTELYFSSDENGQVTANLQPAFYANLSALKAQASMEAAVDANSAAKRALEVAQKISRDDLPAFKLSLQQRKSGANLTTTSTVVDPVQERKLKIS